MSDFLDHHILALPAGITPETIELLARSRFTAARPDGDGIRLSRHSNISPLEVDTHHLRAAKVPSDLPVTWLARTPREREIGRASCREQGWKWEGGRRAKYEQAAPVMG